jgi:hypothetical protein
MLSQRWNHFLVCSSSVKIISSYAQGAIKSFPRKLSKAAHVKTVNIFPLAEHTRKFVRRFLVCSVCDKIASAYAQHAHAIIFKNYSKIQTKMQISTIKYPNFEKTPFRNPSNRTQVNILKQKIFWISLQKNLVPRMLSPRENVRTSKFWRKNRRKRSEIFFENLPRAYKDLI